jgi:ubiquinone/menaquinone biosynthesis C-methylase UbiE
MSKQTDFIPAAHWHFLTPFYHGFMKVFFTKRYQKIVDMIQLQPGETLIDIGCGPGQILKLIHQKYPDNELIGLDVDPEILKIARKNLPSDVKLIESSAMSIPIKDASVDVAISTVMIHHLSTKGKIKMIQEAYRILKPGGRFYLFDFRKPYNWIGRAFVLLFRKVENMDDALDGKYPIWLKEAGFENIQAPYKTHGMLELITSTKP